MNSTKIALYLVSNILCVGYDCYKDKETRSWLRDIAYLIEIIHDGKYSTGLLLLEGFKRENKEGKAPQILRAVYACLNDAQNTLTHRKPSNKGQDFKESNWIETLIRFITALEQGRYKRAALHLKQLERTHPDFTE